MKKIICSLIILAAVVTPVLARDGSGQSDSDVCEVTIRKYESSRTDASIVSYEWNIAREGENPCVDSSTLEICAYAVDDDGPCESMALPELESHVTLTTDEEGRYKLQIRAYLLARADLFDPAACMRITIQFMKGDKVCGWLILPLTVHSNAREIE